MLKQFILKKHLFDYAASSPLPINPWIWVAAWAFVVCSHIFFLYWAFLWTASEVCRGDTSISISLYTSISPPPFLSPSLSPHLSSLSLLTSLLLYITYTPITYTPINLYTYTPIHLLTY
jgi:hypothetical protein